MNKLQSLVLVITLCIVSVSVATAQDFEKGLKAAQSGDYVTALGNLLPLAERGHANAQTVLGALYKEGRGVSQDYVAAASWFRLSAAQGHPTAQLFLGTMHSAGWGVPKDDERAHMWYLIAASNGEMMGFEAIKDLMTRTTSEQMYRGKEMARECMSSNYQNCGW